MAGVTNEEQAHQSDPAAEEAAVAATEQAAGDSSGEKHRGPVVLRGLRQPWTERGFE